MDDAEQLDTKKLNELFLQNNLEKPKLLKQREMCAPTEKCKEMYLKYKTICQNSGKCLFQNIPNKRKLRELIEQNKLCYLGRMQYTNDCCDAKIDKGHSYQILEKHENEKECNQILDLYKKRKQEKKQKEKQKEFKIVNYISMDNLKLQLFSDILILKQLLSQYILEEAALKNNVQLLQQKLQMHKQQYVKFKKDFMIFVLKNDFYNAMSLLFEKQDEISNVQVKINEIIFKLKFLGWENNFDFEDKKINYTLEKAKKDWQELKNFISIKQFFDTIRNFCFITEIENCILFLQTLKKWIKSTMN